MRDGIYEIASYTISSISCNCCSHPFSTFYTVLQSEFYSRHITFKDHFYYFLRHKRRLLDGVTMSICSSVLGDNLYLKGRQLALPFLEENNLSKAFQEPVGIACGTIVWSPCSRLIVLMQASQSKNTITYAFRTLKESGLRSLYRGAGISAISYSIGDTIGAWMRIQLLAIFFEKKQNHFISTAACTAFAFALSAIMMAPIDIVVMQMRLHEANKKIFKDKKLMQVSKNILLTRGWRGFFFGAGTSACYSAVAHMILPVSAHLTR